MARYALALLAAFAAGPVSGAPLCDAFGFAGLLAKCNRGAPITLTLASGQPLGHGPVTLQSGAYYELVITADGSAELGLSGPDFFRAIWMNEILINDIEVRPMAIDGFEFDDEGEAMLGFIAIKPGNYRLAIPGTTAEDQGVTITIE